MGKIRNVAVAAAAMSMPFAAASCEMSSDPVVANIVEAAQKYHLSTAGMVGLAACESTLNERGVSGPNEGLYQHNINYWPKRVAGYNKRHPADRVSGNVWESRSQALVTAEMIATAPRPSAGLGPWECETRFHCYTQPDGSQCKPKYWRGRLAALKTVVINPIKT